MSSKSNTAKSIPRPSPYNKNEIKKAADLFKRDVAKGALSFLQRRFTFTSGVSMSPNLWEGGDGCMEHVRGSFPMPEKVGNEVISNSQINSNTPDQGQSSSSGSSKMNCGNVINTTQKAKNKKEKPQPSSSSSADSTVSNSRINSNTPDQGQNSSSGSSKLTCGSVKTVAQSTKNKKERPQPASSSSNPTMTNSQINSNTTDQEQGNNSCSKLNNGNVKNVTQNTKDKKGKSQAACGMHTVFLSEEEDDCVLLEDDNVVIDVDNDMGDPSKYEYMHWQRLFELHDEISKAKRNLGNIKTLFLTNQTPSKACADIGLLRGQIIVLVNRLKEAKLDIDNRNFSDTLSPKTRETHFKDTAFGKKDVSSYTSIWNLFKSLCNDFVSVREKWKDVLVEHKGFQNSSPTELQHSIQSIKFVVNSQ